MAQPGQEAALQFLGPAQGHGLLMGEPCLLAFEGQPERMGRVLEQRCRVG